MDRPSFTRGVPGLAAKGLVVIGIGTAVAVASVGSDSQPRPRMIIAQSDQLLPSATLTDWRSFADHLVVVTVKSERRLSATAEERTAGEGYIPRVLDLQIDSTMWSRSGAPAPPGSFETELDGWSFSEDTVTPIRLEGEPMMDVGKQYIMPIVYLKVSKRIPIPGWSPLAPETISPYDSGRLVQDQLLARMKAESDTPRGRFGGQEASALAAALRASRPYPELTGSMTLPPDERARLVAEK